MRMKKQFINDMADGAIVHDLFAVKYKKPPVEYKGKEGEWFEIRLADKTGEITAKYWGDDTEKTEKIFHSFEKNEVISIQGRVTTYGEQLQLSIEAGGIRRCLPGEYLLTDFVASTDRNIEEMFHEVMDIINDIDLPLRTLLDLFFTDEDFVRHFKSSPAAMHRHQNYIGGLLEHSLNVAKICQRVVQIHPGLDKSLTLTGALLHDVGKIYEFEVTTHIDVSEEGMLTGHISIGAGFPEILKLKMIHIILSHHGHTEYGSPKTPQFPEAFVVYYADELDAKVDYALKLKKEARTDDPWIWTRDMGHIYLK
jgi:3'-5' exoribonuclease